MTERQKFMAAIELICGGKNADMSCTIGSCISGLDTEPTMQVRHSEKPSNVNSQK